MRDYEYLYGIYGDDIDPIPQNVIMRRVEALEMHLSDLLEVHYENRDTERIREVTKAIEFWEKINLRDMKSPQQTVK